MPSHGFEVSTLSNFVGNHEETCLLSLASMSQRCHPQRRSLAISPVSNASSQVWPLALESGNVEIVRLLLSTSSIFIKVYFILKFH